MNAERGAPMRGECGEALRHRGSRHVGDDVELRIKNGANGNRDIEGKAARAAASERGQ